jgi:hypothetical protein
MPKLLFARPPVDVVEERKIRKLAGARHAPADWIRRRLGMDAHRGQPGAHLGRRHAPGHLIDRPQPQHLTGVVIRLPAVVLAHGPSSASNRRSTKQQSAQ